MNALLSVSLSDINSETLMIALQIIGIGALAVAIVLIALKLLVAIFKPLTSGSSDKDQTDGEIIPIANAKQPSASENEIIAVIAAAIAAAESEFGGKFRVVSFRKK